MHYPKISFLISLVIVTTFSACGEYAATVDGGAADLAPIAGDAGDVDSGQIPRSGDVPFGYYQKQCQWDACGGPMPDRTKTASTPITE